MSTDVFVSPWPWPCDAKGQPLGFVAGATLMLNRAEREITRRAIRGARGEDERVHARRELVELLERPTDDAAEPVVPPSPREQQHRAGEPAKSKTRVRWVQPASLLQQSQEQAASERLSGYQQATFEQLSSYIAQRGAP